MPLNGLQDENWLKLLEEGRGNLIDNGLVWGIGREEQKDKIVWWIGATDMNGDIFRSIYGGYLVGRLATALEATQTDEETPD